MLMQYIKIIFFYFCAETFLSEKEEVRKEISLKKEHTFSLHVEANYINKDNEWYLDSGCTDHLTNQPYLIQNPKNCKVLIRSATGHTEKAVNKGSITLPCLVRGTTSNIGLENVIGVKNLSKNLISVKRICEKGGNVLFINEIAIVRNKMGEVVATAYIYNNLYRIRLKDNPIEALTTDLTTWHRRLGHLSCSKILKLKNHQLVEGLDLVGGVPPTSCEVCAKGKQKRKKFRKEDDAERPQKLGEEISSDVCGPITPQTLTGKRYFISFIDTVTDISEVYLMRNKDEAEKFYLEFEAKLFTQHQKKIKNFRSDGGGEYMSNKFKEHKRSQGTVDIITQKHTTKKWQV